MNMTPMIEAELSVTSPAVLEALLRITKLEAIPVRVLLKADMVTKTAHGDHHTSDYVIVKLYTDELPGRSGRGDCFGSRERRDPARAVL